MPASRQPMSTKARRTLALLRAATRDWPFETPRQYEVRPPNKSLTVFRGAFLLRHNRQKWQMKGSLHLTWLPSPTLHFHGTARGPADLEPGDGRTLHVPQAQRANVAITGATWGARSQASGEIQGVLHLGSNRAVGTIRLHIANFHDFLGTPVKSKGGGGGRRRLSLHSDDWRIELDQASDCDQIVALLRIHGGYGVAHAGVITKTSGEPFTASAAEDILTCVHFFLSFARGFWCGPFVTEGLGRRRRPLWTRWMSHLLATDWRGVASWFPVRNAALAGTAFTGFHDLWCQPIWRNPLRQIVHWYVAANINVAAVEGSLVLAHAALERLAWVRLVVAGSQPEKAFDGKEARERIEALLLELNIPWALPASAVPDLAAWALARGLNGGPAAISAVRNMIVHPKRQAALMQASPTIRIEATRLALWYLEVALLALCRYNGNYVSRLHPGPTVFNATIPVPWVCPT